MIKIFDEPRGKFEDWGVLYEEQQDNTFEERCRQIVQDVRKKREPFLFEMIKNYDYREAPCDRLGVIDMTETQVDLAKKQLLEKECLAIEEAHKEIRQYQQSVRDSVLSSQERVVFQGDQLSLQFSLERKGRFSGYVLRPLERVGVYVPAGTAPLISTVFMTALLADVAGVKDIVVATPPSQGENVHPAIIYACALSGVKTIVKMGGAHAMAAMAYGVALEKVDKIVGPGNIYVATAKKLVYGDVDIDMVAGPSEVMVVAEENANPRHIVLDMLAQLEHDPLSRAIVVSCSKILLKKIQEIIEVKWAKASRKDIIEKSLKNSFMVYHSRKEKLIECVNDMAPEHLSLFVKDVPFYLDNISYAGTVFVGDYTPEAVGDYIAGPSHVLPTAGTARFYSGLQVSSFWRSMSVIGYTKEALASQKNTLVTLAQLEGLDAHAASVKERLS